MNSATRTRDIAVDDDYGHFDKLVEMREILRLSTSDLKWYNIAPKERPVDVSICELAREFVKQEFVAGDLSQLGDLGFVILHRCEHEFYFLLVCSWKNNNELWESIYAKKNVGEPSFLELTYDTSHRGAFCIWELGVVLHEQKSWSRFLASARAESNKADYLNDLFSGTV